MTVDELRRLVVAPEIIVVDIADAALVALRRALLVEHPTLGAACADDDCNVRRRAAAVLRAAAGLRRALRLYRTAVECVIEDHARDDLPF